MSATYFAMDKILNYVFTGTALSQPPSFYIGLATATMTEASTSATEPSGSGYARVSFAGNSTNWNTSSNGALSNKLAISFAVSTGGWGTITTIFIADAVSAGNIWFFDNLSEGGLIAPVSVLNNMVVTIPIGAFDIGLGTLIA